MSGQGWCNSTGKLKDRITFLSVTETVSESGEPIETVEPIKEVFCFHRDVRGKEVFTLSQQIGQPEAVFVIRYQSHTPDVSQRILFRGTTYEIIATPIETGFRDGWEIYGKVRHD